MRGIINDGLTDGGEGAINDKLIDGVENSRTDTSAFAKRFCIVYRP
jgi:hypothetical protein